MEDILRHSTYAENEWPEWVKKKLKKLNKIKTKLIHLSEELESAIDNLGFAYYDDLGDVETKFIEGNGELIFFLKKELAIAKDRVDFDNQILGEEGDQILDQLREGERLVVNSKEGEELLNGEVGSQRGTNGLESELVHLKGNLEEEEEFSARLGGRFTSSGPPAPIGPFRPSQTQNMRILKQRRVYSYYLANLVNISIYLSRLTPYYSYQYDFSVVDELDSLLIQIQKSLFHTYQTVVIPNRGEPSNKILEVAKIMGLKVVILCTKVDVSTPLVKKADGFLLIDSYVDIEGISAAVEKIKKADPERDIAIHPGIGFLAESGEFALACRDLGYSFVGPSAEALLVCDDKGKTKDAATDAYRRFPQREAPLIRGCDIELMKKEEIEEAADAIGYPLVVKRKTGGGGEGVKPVNDREELLHVLEIPANRQSILEKYLGVGYCHIEAQMIGKKLLGLRDCSIQTKTFQKLLEFAEPILNPSTLEAIEICCVNLAEELGLGEVYTVEFLVRESEVSGIYTNGVGMNDSPWEFEDLCSPDVNLIEINPRLQIERRISELVSDVSLIACQLLIADGVPAGDLFPYIERILSDKQSGKGRECALEARIYAQNTEILIDEKQQFPNSKGRVLSIEANNLEEISGITCSWAVEEGTMVTDAYNSQIGTVIAVGCDYEECLLKMIDAMEKLKINGISNNLQLLADVSRSYLLQYILAKRNPTTNSLPKVIDEIYRNSKPTTPNSSQVLDFDGFDPSVIEVLQQASAV